MHLSVCFVISLQGRLINPADHNAEMCKALNCLKQEELINKWKAFKNDLFYNENNKEKCLMNE